MSVTISVTKGPKCPLLNVKQNSEANNLEMRDTHKHMNVYYLCTCAYTYTLYKMRDVYHSGI